jgi:hypothetical protein
MDRMIQKACMARKKWGPLGVSKKSEIVAIKSVIIVALGYRTRLFGAVIIFSSFISGIGADSKNSNVIFFVMVNNGKK